MASKFAKRVASQMRASNESNRETNWIQGKQSTKVIKESPKVRLQGHGDYGRGRRIISKLTQICTQDRRRTKKERNEDRDRKREREREKEKLKAKGEQENTHTFHARELLRRVHIERRREYALAVVHVRTDHLE